jgi:hypothetical protein
MRLAVPLDLGHLDERLQAGARLRQLPSERLSVEGLDREHAPVAEVPDVGDRQHPGSCLLLEAVERAPEVLGVLAVELGDGQRPVADARVPAEDDVAVESLYRLRAARMARTSSSGTSAGTGCTSGGAQAPFARTRVSR